LKIQCRKNEFTAALTCTRPEFADLWQDVMGTTWHLAPLSATRGGAGAGDETLSATRGGAGVSVTQVGGGVIDPAQRQILRDEIDAIVAHLYGLSRAEFAHILGTFPLVFPATPEGQSRKDRLLDVYDAWATIGD